MVEELLVHDENKTLEFKENVQSLSSIIKTVIAFANTAGGSIVIGIQDRTKKVIGVPNPLDEEERLINTISDSISPFLIPDIKIQTYRNKELIIIKIAHSVGPFYLKSAGPDRGIFVRSGSTNRLADSEMIDALKLFARKMTFDEVPFFGKTDLLDWDLINDEFKKINRTINDKKAEHLGLLIQHLNNTYPSNGAIILFGTNRLKAFPDSIIRCARFRGIDKAHVFDHTDIVDYPILALEKAIHFIEKNSFLGAIIGRIRRTDVPQYPSVAIREAVINAIVHTDYAVKGSSIMIAMFDDRIEITNPGGLYFGMTMKDAMSGSSKTRNRVIARVFRELQLIEHWGSGIQRIITACKQRGLELPTFEDRTHEFRVTIYAKKAHKPVLDEDQKAFITLLKKRKRIGTKEAAEFWGIAPRSAREKLKQLLEAGLIKKIGTSAKDPHGGYILAQKTEDQR